MKQPNYRIDENLRSVLCWSKLAINSWNVTPSRGLWRHRENANSLAFDDWCADFYFLSKGNGKEKEALLSFRFLSTGNQWLGSLLTPACLPTWAISLVCLSRASLGTLCCTWVPICGSLALRRRLIKKYKSKVLYFQSRALSQNKKGEIYFLWVMGTEELGTTVHWQGELAKTVLVDFQFIWLILSPLVKWNSFCLGNKTSCFLCHFSSE